MIVLTEEEKTAFSSIKRRRSRTASRSAKLSQIETQLQRQHKQKIFRKIVTELTSPFVADRYRQLRAIAQLERMSEHQLAQEVFDSTDNKTKHQIYPLLKQFIGRSY